MGRQPAGIRSLTLLLALLTGAAAEARQPASGQEQPAAVQEPAQKNVADKGVDEPTKDLFDILRQLRHKPPPPAPGADAGTSRMIAAAPVITYNPTSGIGIGAAGNVAFYNGSPDTTRISSVVASLIGTSKKQVLVNAKVNSWARDNRWHIQGDNRFYWTSQKTYGLGSDSPESAAVDQKYDAFRVYETVFRSVARDTTWGRDSSSTFIATSGRPTTTRPMRGRIRRTSRTRSSTGSTRSRRRQPASPSGRSSTVATTRSIRAAGGMRMAAT